VRERNTRPEPGDIAFSAAIRDLSGRRRDASGARNLPLLRRYIAAEGRNSFRTEMFHSEGADLRILVLHNSYKEKGGEDAVFSREVELLRAHGHGVETYAVHNDEIDGWSILERAVRPIWNPRQYRLVSQLLRDFPADIVHVHNFYAVLSPAVCHAARRHGAAVVQSLHNYRLGCPSAGLLREGRACTDCLGKTFAWPGVLHGCYRGSRAASFSVAATIAAHHLIGTWRQTVDAYIVLSEFARGLLAEAGIPRERLYVKPNFAPEPSARLRSTHRRGALFVGRLTAEKGVPLLLDAWRHLDIPLRVIGSGPLMPAAPPRQSSIEFLGLRSSQEVMAAMGEAALLVMPATWYEPFGLVVVEAFSMGLPVLASRLGALPEIITHGETGLLFDPGSVDSIVSFARQAFADPESLARMGENAYAAYRAHYSPEVNYAKLIAIYHRAIARRRNLPSNVRAALNVSARR
jgi:glycosyltransferase involved in cell wall biosynthesis